MRSKRATQTSKAEQTMPLFIRLSEILGNFDCSFGNGTALVRLLLESKWGMALLCLRKDI